MAEFSSPKSFIPLIFLLFQLHFLAANQDASFMFKNLGKDSNFESKVALFGDAKAFLGESRVQLTNSVSSSAGRVMFKKPIKFFDGIPRKSASFSTLFSFSMCSENGESLAFSMVPLSSSVSKVFDSSSFGISPRKGKSNVIVVAVGFDENHVGRSGVSRTSYEGERIFYH